MTKLVFWKKNLFELQRGAIGKAFISEITKLINEWCTKSPNRDICLKALMIMPALILQKTSMKCKTSEIKKHIERRLVLWRERKVQDLFDEAKTIQARMKQVTHKARTDDELAKRFAKLMLEGKVNPAIRLLEVNATGGVLPLTDEVIGNLQQKHPAGKPTNDTMLLQGPLMKIHDVIYDDINAELIRKCATKTKGSFGPSCLDADFWRKITSSTLYGSSSDDLCHAIALLTRQLCSDNLNDPNSIEALMSCRLIPLDKAPGIRPIGIGEVLRRIIGKAVMTVIKPDILNATGYQQLCAGQNAGCEVAIHAVRDLFELDSNHGFIQIDASNAFNAINRKLLLHNVNIICPQISTYINNCYAHPARLFITGGKEMSSQEGTTQGDPIAMGMYALGLMPLLTTVAAPDDKNFFQVAFADDLTGVGEIDELKVWWENILKFGPYLGYNVNESKSWLITKERYINQAKTAFKNSAIKITTDGHRHLGAVVGTQANKENYVKEKVTEWINAVNNLTKFACTEPHAAYSAFIHGLRHRFTYTMRTIPDISHLLKPLDDAIDNFTKVLLHGYEFNKDERSLFSLPARFGGMGMIIPSQISQQEYLNSRSVTSGTIEKVKLNEIYSDNNKEVGKIKDHLKSEKRKQHGILLNEIKEKTASKQTLRSIEAATENGASIWLTVLPIKRNGFFLEKQAFWDGIHIRYNIPLERLPTKCVCGFPFDLQHAFSCPKGGLVIARHNEIRDITAEILGEICTGVTVEPTLTPLTGESLPHATAIKSDQARADVSARVFWIKGQIAYCDVRVFNPIAKCHLNKSLPSVHKKNENEKKRQYNQRILQIEHGSFTPLVFSCFGGMSRECSRFFSQAADKLSEKRKTSKSVVMAWIKARLNFALLRSCLQCLRGTRTSSNVAEICEIDIKDIALESNIEIYAN